MQFLVLGDPIDQLFPRSDTSLSLVRSALARGHEVFWCTPADLVLYEGRVFGQSSPVDSIEPKELPMLGESKLLPIGEFDSVWIRKDPPFDQIFLSFCWLLRLEEKNTVLLNSPDILLRHHEKLLPFEALGQGYLQESEIVSTYLPLGNHSLGIKPDYQGEVVHKPWFGYGGRGIEQAKTVDLALEQVFEMTPFEPRMIQPEMKDIVTEGDRRVFFIEGEYLGDIVRVPEKGSIISNLAQGGSAELRPLSQEARDVCDRVGQFLKEIGVHFAGADLIGKKISEINVTSPTGFEALVDLGGPQLADRFLETVEARVIKRRS